MFYGSLRSVDNFSTESVLTFHLVISQPLICDYIYIHTIHHLQICEKTYHIRKWLEKLWAELHNNNNNNNTSFSN